MDPLTLVAIIGATSFVLGIAVGYLGYRSRMGPRTNPSQRRHTIPIRRAQVNTNDAQQLRDIYDLISSLTATLKYQRVLELALELSASVLTSETDPDRLVGAVLLFAKNEIGNMELGVGAARRLTPADMRITLPGTRGLLASVLERGEPVRHNNIAGDVEVGRFVAMRTCSSAYCLPLRAGLDTYGVLLFAHPSPGYFTEVNRELLELIAHQSVIALQNARLYSDLEQEKERMMEIQDEARRKLARDLHDGPTQSIAAIAMRVNFVRRLLDRDVAASADELQKVEDLARRTTKEIRHMLFTLRPLILESQGLAAALDAMAEKMTETYSQEIIVEADPKIIPRLEINKQAVIFYIVEEAATNARKHAQAEHIWIRLKALDNDLALLEVQDDGIGFDVSTIAASYDQRGSLGMINMRERAELVNGVLRIESAENEGTTIQVVIPLTEAGQERLRQSGKVREVQ
jgi:signal transduction histidine kinase